MGFGAILGGLLSSSGSSGGSGGSSLTKNIGNPRVKGKKRIAANFLDPGGLLGLFRGNEEPERFEGIRPFESLKEIPEGARFSEELLNRIEGRRVGFRPEVISGATAPFAKQRRAGLKEETLPGISAQASSRGLGRSTIPVNRGALASQAAERDIEERVAQLAVQNEVQRRNEINQANQLLGQFAQAEAATRAQAAGFDFGEFTGNRAFDFTQGQADAASQNAAISSIASAFQRPKAGGSTIGGTTLNLGSLSGGGAVPSVGTTGAGTGQATGGPASQVNVGVGGGQNVPVSQAELKQIFAELQKERQ